MSIWKPPGTVAESAARWESNPDRGTFFLEALVESNSRGTFTNTPNVSTYNEVSKLLWARFAVYHTPKQLRNYYGNRKAFWANVCWARERTGIGWDESKKMILATDEWWQSNEGRRGLLALRDKPIQDFDLLHTLFGGQRAVADHCYCPFEPIPINSDEGSGDSGSAGDEEFFEPQTQASAGAVSMNTSSGSKRTRRNTSTATKKVKKNNEEKLSPYSARIDRQFNSLCGAKARRRMRMDVESNPVEVNGGVGTAHTQIPSHTPSGTINSPSNMDMCMKIITQVLQLDDTSDFYFDVLDLLLGNPDAQSVLLGNDNPVTQLAWLRKKLRPACKGYDLNEPPL